MKKSIMTLAVAAVVGAGTCAAAGDATHRNPFMQPFATQYSIPPFAEITVADYLPALKAAIAKHDNEIKALSLIHISEPTRPY